MSQVTIEGSTDPETTVLPTFAEALAPQSKSSQTEEVPETVSQADIDERISKAKEAAKFSYNRTLEKQESSNKDRYRNSANKTTYYYENISQFELAWSHPEKNIPPTPIGGVIDFFDYFDKEEDILNFKSIRKNEFPHNIKPLIRRLTPEQYLQKLERNRQIEAQKNQYHAEVKGKDKGTDDNKVSSTVQYRVQEYLTWEARSKEEKAKSTYSKFDFIQWINGWTFTEPEFRTMLYQIRDAEVLKAIAERKQELMSI